MIVITKKQIIKITSFVFIGMFTILFCSMQFTIPKEEIVETSSLPVSGKVIVVDAGHGVPDEGAFLLHKENKQLTFYK